MWTQGYICGMMKSGCEGTCFLKVIKNQLICLAEWRQLDAGESWVLEEGREE